MSVAETAGVGLKTARAAVWSILSLGGAKIITVVSLAVLARILAPAEFGLLAFAMTYMTYAETIGDLGTGLALIYWPDRREEASQVTFITNLVAGSFWTLLTIAIAPFVADFFNAPNGAPIVRALSVSFLIKYLGNTHDALAKKDLRFRARTIPELSLTSIKAAVSIVLGYLGFGAWSLVWGHIAGITAWTIFLWIVVPWRPSLAFPRDLFGPMLRYGRGMIALNMISAINHHADLAVVGRYAGVYALGLYQVASKLPEATVIVAIWALSSVLFPAFSRIIASGESLARPYLMATRYIAAITMPAGAGVACLAGPIILLGFGEKWTEAAPIVAALSIHAAVRSLSNAPGDVLKATGRASVLAWVGVLRAVVTVPALVIVAPRGGTAVAITLTAVAVLFTVILLLMVQPAIGVRLRSTIAALAPSTFAAAIMAAAVLAWSYYMRGFGPLAQITGGIAVGVVTYAAALRVLDPEILRRAIATFTSRRPPSAPPPGADQ
jgi:PST family polysaccharide transporter